jgi:DNA repair protein RadC
MHVLPPVRAMPNRNLLALLLGEDVAASLAERPLAEVFSLHAGHVLREGQGIHRVVEAAKELMARALAEPLHQGDCLASPATVKDYLRLKLAGLPHEVFLVLLLDSQNCLIDCVELFRGTLNQTSVYPREVVKLALQGNAAGVMFAHNHPSGVVEPSAADTVLTRTLKDALALVDVRVHDHFIVASTAPPLSFAERGLL